MHHQTAKAAYRILTGAAELVDERGFTKAPADNGKLTVLGALARATHHKSPTAAVAAHEALEKEVGGSLANFEPRDKRVFVAKLNAAAKRLAKEQNINLEKV